jgi:hypothetical protein
MAAFFSTRDPRNPVIQGPRRTGSTGLSGSFQFNDPDIIQGVTSFTGGDPIDELAASAGNELLRSGAGLSEQAQALFDIEGRVGERGRVQEARAAARRGVDVDAGTFERQTRGLDFSPRQKAAARKRVGLARAIAQASAAGDVRRRGRDRAEAVRRISGPFADVLFGQRIEAEADEANIFGQKVAAREERTAKKKGSVIGAVGSVIGGLLSFASSEKLKDNLGSETQLLDRLKKVRVNRWNYRGDEVQHIGPFSEEFNREFEIKTDRPDRISVIDALGVTLGAVKELNEKVEARGI